MSSPELVQAVKVVKRSGPYREQRASLVSPAPVDVWADPEDGVYFVLFPLKAQGALGSFLGFVVRIQDDQLLRVGVLSVRFSPEGWQVHVSS